MDKESKPTSTRAARTQTSLARASVTTQARNKESGTKVIEPAGEECLCRKGKTVRIQSPPAHEHGEIPDEEGCDTLAKDSTQDSDDAQSEAAAEEVADSMSKGADDNVEAGFEANERDADDLLMADNSSAVNKNRLLEDT